MRRYVDSGVKGYFFLKGDVHSGACTYSPFFSAPIADQNLTETEN